MDCFGTCMLPTHDVPCPHCGKPLYSSISLDEGVNSKTPECPRVDRDGAGYYMRCPHCRNRVPMERLQSGDSEAFRLAR